MIATQTVIRIRRPSFEVTRDELYVTDTHLVYKSEIKFHKPVKDIALWNEVSDYEVSDPNQATDWKLATRPRLCCGIRHVRSIGLQPSIHEKWSPDPFVQYHLSCWQRERLFKTLETDKLSQVSGQIEQEANLERYTQQPTKQQLLDSMYNLPEITRQSLFHFCPHTHLTS